MKKLLNMSIILLIFINIIIIFNFKRNNPRKLENFNEVSFYDVENNLIKTQYHRSNSRIEMQEIDHFLVNALITLEDKNFFTHLGTDLTRMIKVFFTNIYYKEKQGASTLTQQLARTLYLNNEKTFLRKLKEFYYTIQLERTYSKHAILESYINNIYLGHNLYGFSDASKYYFNKKIYELNEREMLLLINLIKNPTLYNPLENPEHAETALIKSLEILFQEEVIDRSQYHDIINQETHLIGKKSNKAADLENFYLDYIRQLLSVKDYNLPKNNYLPKKIYTYYDSRFSNLIESFLKRNEFGPEISIVMMEPKTFHLKFMMGSKNYNFSSYNRALNSKRQVGSSIKPFLYYTALKYGFSGTTKMVSEKTDFTDQTVHYSPSNFNHSYDNKPITLAYALATSDNIYAVKTLAKLGTKRFSHELKKIDFDFDPLNLTSSLGSNVETLYNMTRLYNIFASMGTETEIQPIHKIYLDDRLYFRQNSFFKKNELVLNSDILFILNDLLTLTFDSKMNQVNKVTGNTIAPYMEHKFAAKTGLTDNDCYFFAFNPLVTIGIWTGYDELTPLSDQESYLPKKVFIETINLYLKDQENIWYEKPKNIAERESYLTEQYKRKSYFLD